MQKWFVIEGRKRSVDTISLSAAAKIHKNDKISKTLWNKAKQTSRIKVRGIPNSECQLYLGVEIGRQADPQKAAAEAVNLYGKDDLLLQHNPELNKCSSGVKNMVM